MGRHSTAMVPNLVSHQTFTSSAFPCNCTTNLSYATMSGCSLSCSPHQTLCIALSCSCWRCCAHTACKVVLVSWTIDRHAIVRQLLSSLHDICKEFARTCTVPFSSFLPFLSDTVAATVHGHQAQMHCACRYCWRCWASFCGRYQRSYCCRNV